MRYRRSNTPGGTFFFTVNLEDRAKRMLVERIDTLRASVRHVKAQHPFDIIAWVVLPEHLHAIWSLPPDDGDFSTRWMLIKAGFSRRVERAEAIGSSRLRKGERGIWQRRFWEHQIRDDQDLQRHVDYLHLHPVKHGHIARAAQWPWSSIHHYIRTGLLTADWAGDGCTIAPGAERIY